MTLCRPCQLLGEPLLHPREYVRRSLRTAVEFRNVGLPSHRGVEAVRQGSEHAVKQITVCNLEELVAVEREDEIAAVTH